MVEWRADDCPIGAQITAPKAIVIAGIVIAAAIIGGRLLAPYRLSTAAIAGGYMFVWRLNSIAGAIQSCKPEPIAPPTAEAMAAAKAADHADAGIAANLDARPSSLICK